MLKNIRGYFANQLLLAMLFSGGLSFFLLLFIHDIFWWPADEGVFAYTAEQLIQGQIYGVDFYDIHPGYHTFVNALMFKVFGHELVVMRYPLVLLGVLQSMMVTYLLRRRGGAVAALSGFSITTFGFMQYPGTLPSWYCLFFAFVAIFTFLEMPNSGKRNFILGLLIGLSFMFRHPNGIFLGLGVLTYLIYEASSKKASSKLATQIAYLLLIAVLFSLIYYSFIAFEVSAFILLGAWPIALTIAVIFMVRKFDKSLINSLIFSALGIFAAILPMILYQLILGDLSAWFKSTFLVGTNIFDAGFFFQRRYWHYLLEPVAMLVSGKYGVFDILFLLMKAIYWLLILSLPLLIGATAIKLYKSGKQISACFFIAVFYSYVSFYYQIPVYYCFSLSLFILCFFYHFEFKTEKARKIIIPVLMLLITSAIFLESQFVNYSIFNKYTKSEIERMGLYIEREDEVKYKQLLKIIDENSQPDDYIFSFPLNPELFFLSGRKNPFPFYSTAFYIVDDESYDIFWNKIISVKPKIMIFNSQRGYVEDYDLKLRDDIQKSGYYKPAIIYDGFQFFVLKNGGGKPHSDTSGS